jgi:hypothetical protein
MKIETFSSACLSVVSESLALHLNYETPFIDKAINGIPLQVDLFFVAIAQARNDGSIGVLRVTSDVIGT